MCCVQRMVDGLLCGHVEDEAGSGERRRWNVGQLQIMEEHVYHLGSLDLPYRK